MIELKTIKLKNGAATGIKIDMPQAPFLLIATEKGFVHCGFMDMEICEKKGDSACIVNGVSSFEDALKAKIIKITTRAQEVGVKLGEMGEEALTKMV